MVTGVSRRPTRRSASSGRSFTWSKWLWVSSDVVDLLELVERAAWLVSEPASRESAVVDEKAGAPAPGELATVRPEHLQAARQRSPNFHFISR